MLCSSTQAAQNKHCFWTKLSPLPPFPKQTKYFQWPSDRNLTLITCFVYSCCVVGVQRVILRKWTYFNIASGAGRNTQCVLKGTMRVTCSCKLLFAYVKWDGIFFFLLAVLGQAQNPYSAVTPDSQYKWEFCISWVSKDHPDPHTTTGFSRGKSLVLNTTVLLVMSCSRIRMQSIKGVPWSCCPSLFAC